MALEWETICQISTHDFTQRLQVPGGWIICRISGIRLPCSLASWFVSDPDHLWVVEHTSTQVNELPSLV